MESALAVPTISLLELRSAKSNAVVKFVVWYEQHEHQVNMLKHIMPAKKKIKVVDRKPCVMRELLFSLKGIRQFGDAEMPEEMKD